MSFLDEKVSHPLKPNSSKKGIIIKEAKKNIGGKNSMKRLMFTFSTSPQKKTDEQTKAINRPNKNIYLGCFFILNLLMDEVNYFYKIKMLCFN